MDLERAKRIFTAAEGLSRRDWETIRDYIDRAYEAAARDIELAPEAAQQTLMRMANECGGGWAQPEGARQTRMF